MTIRRASRCSLFWMPPGNSQFSISKYFGSPTIGWPIWAACARSWCVRPVTGFSDSQASFWAAVSTDGVIGQGVAGALVAVLGDPHPRIALVALLLGEVGRDAALPDARHAGHERPIDLARHARPEGLGHGGGGKARLGDDEAAGRILVEPVHEARLLALLVASAPRAGRPHAAWCPIRPARRAPSAC